MNPEELHTYRRWLRSRIPILGWWLRGRAIAALAQDGSAQTVTQLADAVLEDCLDEAEHERLSRAIVRWRPPLRALFYFLTEQWEKYETLDLDRSLLRAIYQTADHALRQRIMEQARRAG
ncbi:MAG: hypothetical protein D6690_01300, partial [Nitrospirae bacterium]